MIQTLIRLADKLDQCKAKEAADIVDQLVKNAIGEEEELDDLLEPRSNWDEPTKVRTIVRSLPAFDPQMLEYTPGLGARDLAAQLKHIFERAGDPMSWDEEVKEKTRLLMNKLQQVL